MKKISNLVFITLVLIVCLLGVYALVRKPKEISYEENRQLNKIPNFTIETFIKQEYQENLENSLSDQFLGSAFIKQNYSHLYNFSSWINLKNKICHNNYFSLGLEYSIYDCSDYIVFNPVKTFYDKNNEILNSYRKLNNKVDTYYYYINTSKDIDFRTNKKTTDVSKLLKHTMKKNYKYSELKIKNYDNYKHYFYKNDHHWNYQGSYQGYLDIIKMFGIKNSIKPNKKVVFSNYYYYGSLSNAVRNYDNLDEFTAYQFKLPKHSTTINKKEGIYGQQKQYFNHQVKYDKSTGMYGDFYGWDYGEIVFDFNQKNKNNLLIISNSYSNAINELLASHFNKTFVIDLRNYKNDIKEELDIEKYIKKNSINKVLVIMDYSFITSNSMKLKWGGK